MKIMLDTNVLVSAFVFGGAAGSVIELLLDSEHELYVSEYVDLELYKTLMRKWPAKTQKIYQMYHTLHIHFCSSTDQILGMLRDKKDIPVLSDARYHKVDILLTGDKDFLETDIETPMILSPSMLLKYAKAHPLTI